jgi:uncharacterized protein with GYD domain
VFRPHREWRNRLSSHKVCAYAEGAVITQGADMPTFITYASYSHSGIKGLVDKPSDRTEVIKGLVEKAGGKLIALYMTTGAHDVVLISEVPDGSDAVAAGMAAAASGALSQIETVRAWPASEFKGIAEKAAKVAGAYKPPGG